MNPEAEGGSRAAEPEPDDWFDESLAVDRLASRAHTRFPRRLFLVLRLSIRLIEALTAFPAGVPLPWLAVAAACGCAALDVGLAASQRRGWRWRPVAIVLLDSCDAALWSWALRGASDIAVNIASPTAAIWGLRHGWRGLAVPAAVGSAVLLTMHLTGYPVTALVYAWPALAVGFGMLAAGYLRTRWRQDSAAALRDLEAAAGQAELSGQNSVAMGADSVVDLLSRTGPLLAAYERDAAPPPFAGWKAALAERCGRHSAYLGVSLARWQYEYNGRSPDLSADVQLRPRPGAGTLLLSPAQELALFAALEQLAPRGVVSVDAPSVAPVGQEQTVVVGATRIVIAADRRAPARPLHPAPLILAWGAGLTLAHPVLDGVPWAAAAPLAAALLACAWLFHQLLGPEAASTRRLMPMVALALGAADALTATLTAATGPFDHTHRLPFVYFLDWFAPLLVFYLRDLTPRLRGALALGAAAVVVVGAMVAPVPVGAWEVLRALVWPLAGCLTVLGLRDLLDLDGADLHEQLNLKHRQVVDEGFQQGRRFVIDAATGAVADLRRRFDAARENVPGETAAELERRLTQAQVNLTALADGG